MHSGYKELDDAICEHIAALPWRHPIYSQKLLLMAASEIGRDVTESDEKVWRLIDRRLQALRKAGVLKHERASLNGVGGWRVLKTPNV